MDEFVGLHGVIVDPDTSKNNPEDLIEVSLYEKGNPPGTAGLSAPDRG